MNYIRKIKLEELIQLLIKIRDSRGCEFVDMEFQSDTNTVTFYPYTVLEQKLLENKKPKGSDLNDLSS